MPYPFSHATDYCGQVSGFESDKYTIKAFTTGTNISFCENQFSVSKNIISWYVTPLYGTPLAATQLNKSEETYHYLILGEE